MTKQKVQAGRNWYAVHTYAGYEDAVVRNLKQRIESLGMEDKIFSAVVPTEKKIKIVGGKRKTIEERIYPGYVLVDMIVTDNSWYVVRNTPRVTGFVGAGTTPVPLDKKDVNTGDVVRINDGPFKDFEGAINAIDEEKGKIKILISMFGRETPVEIDYLQVKKI